MCSTPLYPVQPPSVQLSLMQRALVTMGHWAKHRVVCDMVFPMFDIATLASVCVVFVCDVSDVGGAVD